MIRIATLSLTLVGAAFSVNPGQATPVGVSHADCKVTRIMQDGREIVSMSKGGASSHKGGATASASGGSASASVRSHSGSSHSSSSASSSASTGKGGTARAVSSHTDENGRTVTTTHDKNGCAIVIDERET